MHRLAAIACLLLGCRGEDVAPARPPPPPSEPPAPAIDAAPPVDAGPACASSEHRFRVGTLTAPPGWCWHRTAEGDDQSGVLRDPAGRIRARFTELSFAERVGDPCEASPARTLGKTTYRICARDTSRHCLTFHGLANLCTVPPEAPDLSLEALVATLHPK